MGAKPSTERNEESDQERTYSTSSSSDLGAGFNILRSLQNVNISVDRQRARSLSSVPDDNESTHETDSSSLDSPTISATNFSLARVYATTHSLPSHICSWSNGKCKSQYMSKH
ncbi:hypothetical protein WDU94_003380 [Cyamophila willieti]